MQDIKKCRGADLSLKDFDNKVIEWWGQWLRIYFQISLKASSTFNKTFNKTMTLWMFQHIQIVRESNVKIIDLQIARYQIWHVTFVADDSKIASNANNLGADDIPRDFNESSALSLGSERVTCFRLWSTRSRGTELPLSDGLAAIRSIIFTWENKKTKLSRGTNLLKEAVKMPCSEGEVEVLAPSSGASKVAEAVTPCHDSDAVC